MDDYADGLAFHTRRSSDLLGRRLSRWLALQTMLGLGLVCAAVYGVASMTLEQHQHETLDLKQQAVLHLMTESRSAHNERSEEHTSELQSLRHIVCRLQLEK